MGGFFGCAKHSEAISDVFFGTDYHSHLGTRCGGIAAYNTEVGLQRQIHSNANSPFRTKFENIFEEISGNSAISCIKEQFIHVTRVSVIKAEAKASSINALTIESSAVRSIFVRAV